MVNNISTFYLIQQWSFPCISCAFFCPYYTSPVMQIFFLHIARRTECSPFLHRAACHQEPWVVMSLCCTGEQGRSYWLPSSSHLICLYTIVRQMPSTPNISLLEKVLSLNPSYFLSYLPYVRISGEKDVQELKMKYTISCY